MDTHASETPQDLLRSLQAAWRGQPAAAVLDAAVQGVDRVGSTDTASALKAVRVASLALARLSFETAALLPLLRRGVHFYVGRPIREWDEVIWALDLALAAPLEARRLIRTVVVSVRLGVKGSVPSLANLGSWGDATHELLPVISEKLEQLFARRRELGGALYRQLVKTLPHLGASGTELYDVRNAPEGLQWLLDCPLTLDIREQIHSHASPANLTLVRAYLLYLEKNDPSGLQALWLAQKIPEHDAKLQAAANPAELKQKLIEYTREIEAILTRIYAFDPESPESVLGDVALWLRAVGTHAPPDAAALIEHCRRRETRPAVAALSAMRQHLAQSMASATPGTGLMLLHLDLELEKLGYLLFGEVVNVDFATVTPSLLPEVIAVMQAMLESEILKDWNRPRLAWLSRALRQLPDSEGDRLASLMVLNHQINDEIARMGLEQYRNYNDVARGILQASRAAQIEVEVNTFVDGLIRGTTLQHIGELALRLHHFVLDSIERKGAGWNAEARARVEQYHRRHESEAAWAASDSRDDSTPPMWIRRFRPGHPDDPAVSAEQLGGKGANLCIMCALGLPVPPGFIVSARACERYMSIHALDPSMHAEIREALAWLESVTGKTFGSPRDPLLVSVRSGAAVSMPGMLDTILNVGMTDDIARALGTALSDETAALDSYLHFLLGYARSVFALEGIAGETRPSPTWESVAAIKRRVLEAGLEPFWESTDDQLVAAVEAVFRSWNNPHAVLFREMHHMPPTGCTAATVQQMVLGNADARSCTGVVFTRKPLTGAPELYGEYLPQAHGEDLVSGWLTPLPICRTPGHPGRSLEETMPDIVEQLRAAGARLESRFGGMQDIEFTVERGKLYLLQTRAARQATVGTAPGSPPVPGRWVAEARRPVAAGQEPPRYRIVARGLGASPGGVVGRIALTRDAACRFAQAGESALFVRATTTPEDLAGMAASAGVLTQRGGVTSHAANNARYMGKPCVVGCLALGLDEPHGTVTLGDTVLHEGDLLFIDGMTGEVGLPLNG